MIKKQHYKSTLLTTLLISFSLSIAQAAINPKDWDNDGLSDDIEKKFGSLVYLADTDGDGINDKKEFGSQQQPLDTDNDKIFNFRDFDDDGDGIPSVLEGIEDSDNDGLPNYLDLDSDNDGIADSDEVTFSGLDHDEDGIDDIFDTDKNNQEDDNGDGIVDQYTFADKNKNNIADIYDPEENTIEKKEHLQKELEQKEQEQKKKTQKEKELSQKNQRVPPILLQEEPVKQIMPSILLEERPVKKKEKPDSAESESILDSEVMDIPMVSAPPPKLLAESIKPDESTEELIGLSQSKEQKQSLQYGGSGYFYCVNTGKIVSAVSNFIVSPQQHVTVINKAKTGHYVWGTEQAGVFSLKFDLAEGFEIVPSFTRGRRIIKRASKELLILGVGENIESKGYMVKMNDFSHSWYTSFEFKEGAPKYINNNIPLKGAGCSASLASK